MRTKQCGVVDDDHAFYRNAEAEMEDEEEETGSGGLYQASGLGDDLDDDDL